MDGIIFCIQAQHIVFPNIRSECLFISGGCESGLRWGREWEKVLRKGKSAHIIESVDSGVVPRKRAI